MASTIYYCANLISIVLSLLDYCTKALQLLKKNEKCFSIVWNWHDGVVCTYSFENWSKVIEKNCNIGSYLTFSVSLQNDWIVVNSQRWSRLSVWMNNYIVGCEQRETLRREITLPWPTHWHYFHCDWCEIIVDMCGGYCLYTGQTAPPESEYLLHIPI